MTRAHSAAIAFEGVPSRAASRALLERTLRRRRTQTADFIVTVPAPVAKPDALLRAFPNEASLLWDPPRSAACSGLGVAKALSSDTSVVARFFDRTAHVVDASSPRPRVFGGSSFAPGAADRSPWTSFGDDFLLLPTWTYHVDQRAWLSLALCDSERLPTERLLRVFDAIWDSLECPTGVSPSPVSTRCVDEADRESWLQWVEEIRHQIRSGVFEKVVAARHRVVELEAGADALDVLQRLEERFPGCTRFAFWRDQAVFLGATPELLISRRGPSVLSEALAGSTAHGDAARMMASAKERQEHQLVVQGILRSLEPLCDSLFCPSKPSVRELPNLLHMQTPVEGHLREPIHILDLVQTLHPTPAVGGVPTKRAIGWIVEREAVARGWYSAPVGWTDAEGDGEFVVALRSGLLRDGKAWVYAGAGIMADSDPDAEYAETELKMQALLGALHGDGR